MWRFAPTIIQPCPLIQPRSGKPQSRGKGGAGTPGNERLLPSSGMGFLPLSVPGMGCVFLSFSMPGNIQQLPSGRGKGSRRGSVYSLEENGMQPAPGAALWAPWPRERARSSLGWGILGEPSMEKSWIGRSLGDTPRGKGRTPPGSHGVAVPNSQPGTGDENKSQPLSLWGRLGAFWEL